MRLCRKPSPRAKKPRDFISREQVQALLEDTEERIDWLETQLALIERIGVRIGCNPAMGAGSREGQSGKSSISLQKLLAGELAAIDQYFVHSRMYHDWGLTRLYERISHETEEEKQHADALIRRMLFLETTPDLSQRETLNVGADVPGC